ncbi:YjcZ family sporulation protein [Neobacillus sp. LXY-4]|uniref:YjcZ family sporulation protein n=1 Tax=Neobacillus sp. LXY-4 TaxID=3379826 RepID=UPI003EDEB9A1
MSTGFGFGFGSDFALIVVLFILLIIVGASGWGAVDGIYPGGGGGIYRGGSNWGG